MLTDHLPRVTIAHLPTPLEPSGAVGVKRDDQTGLATGGNKTRKLEFLVADALRHEANTLITCGAAQSNHARQTAAAAAKFGLDRILVLRGQRPTEVTGNLLLDHLLAADIVWAGVEPLDERMEKVAEQLRAEGQRPYVVSYGGSNAVGATGYAAAIEELLNQAQNHDLAFDHIVLASSSGGTQAGLEVGARALGYQGRILGISVEPKAAVLRETLAGLASKVADHLDLELAFEPADFSVNDEYLGGGYGVVSDLERDAIRTLARTESLLLDPVYTGRAFGGLLDMICRGKFQSHERVLFWHTGGTAGLFDTRRELLAT